MAPKRKKQGLLDDLVDIFALTPWWVPAIATVAVYVFMDAVIHWPLPWVWAGVVLLTGVVGQGTRHQRRDMVAKTQTIDLLKGLSWNRFEVLVAEAYRQRGYSVAETSGGADGGVDLVLRSGGQTTYVQCKQWRQRQVGVRPVRELYGCMADGRAERGVLLCSGTYTAEARRWAEGKRLELLDGHGVLTLLGHTAVEAGAAVQGLVETPVPAAPQCPRCGREMILRTARKGLNPGAEFWGCPAFPDCRGTRELIS
jgi:restriction system protein